MPVISGAGFAQTIANTAGGEAVTAASIPSAAKYAEGSVRTAALKFTRDNTAPTTSVGMKANVDDIIILRSRSEIDFFLGIRATGTSAVVDWEFHNSIP